MYNGTGGNELSGSYGNSLDFTDEHFYRLDLTNLYSKDGRIDPACKKSNAIHNSHSFISFSSKDRQDTYQIIF
jgi:hypothetical protein